MVFLKKCGILVLSLALAGCGCGSSKKEDKPSQAVSSISKSERITSSELKKESEVQSIDQIEPHGSISEDKAKEITELVNYLAIESYKSEKDIYDWLDLEEYSSEETEYALDYLKTLNVDYNQNALNLAKELEEKENESKKGIHESLVILQFTNSQIQYAMDNLGDIDFKENALKRAQFLKELDSLDIYDALINIYFFTPQEAQYAIDHLEN